MDIRTAISNEMRDNKGSFLQGLHQAVWDILKNLARMTSGKQTQESREDWKRYHDRYPPKKVSSRDEATNNAGRHSSETVSLLDLEEQSCSDRASVIDTTQEMLADRSISSRTAIVLHRSILMKHLTEK